ncbi:MAG: hypothetical protein JRE88_13425 [Deltaproteobacteria bacterium]|jgi:hypothetical protein|nr:hypothetical protein [Deltaproteobacteria bacterium]MBW2517778.1 hypothetical protein [Deltaproteobacteria bacterium]
MNHRLKYITALFLLSGLLGCASATVYYPGKNSADLTAAQQQAKELEYRKNVKRLEWELIALGPAVDPIEARQVAETAIRESAILAEEYQLIRPAVAHNLLIAIGIKERGLCYQWAEDLMERLEALALKSFQLHWAVAYRGSNLREHNCVVVTAAGQPFSKGILFDPWRHSGNLYWTPVVKDSYPWEILPPTQW